MKNNIYSTQYPHFISFIFERIKKIYLFFAIMILPLHFYSLFHNLESNKR